MGKNCTHEEHKHLQAGCKGDVEFMLTTIDTFQTLRGVFPGLDWDFSQKLIKAIHLHSSYLL